MSKEVVSLAICSVPLRVSRSKLNLFFIAFFAAIFLTSCSFIPREPFSAGEQAAAGIPGFPEVRFWVDANEQQLRAFSRASGLAATLAASDQIEVLAISGGAYDGAYGVGIVHGWTATGRRPKFKIVTGVSAGALIAPFAFLGPSYDRPLVEAFTSGAADMLGDLGGVLALLGTPDLRRSTLVDLVDKYVDVTLLAAIAAEHAKGRRLYVVTTNLDAQRGVVWDMGAIACRGPAARELFRDILVASASIPGFFAPTYIEVEASGHRFREMHVDGGATTQVFIVPDIVLARGGEGSGHGAGRTHIWAVINNHLTPQFEVVEAGLLPTVSRSFSTLIKNNAKQTLFATAEIVGRDNFSLTYIDDGFDRWLKANFGESVTPGFNQAYMRALYRYAYNKALSGHVWTNEVPLPGADFMHFREIARQ